jgi:hypothetical protein
VTTTHANLSADERDRRIDVVIARLRFGDSDGDDHDIAAKEIERLRGENEVLRLGFFQLTNFAAQQRHSVEQRIDCSLDVGEKHGD